MSKPLAPDSRKQSKIQNRKVTPSLWPTKGEQEFFNLLSQQQDILGSDMDQLINYHEQQHQALVAQSTKPQHKSIKPTAAKIAQIGDEGANRSQYDSNMQWQSKLDIDPVSPLSASSGGQHHEKDSITPVNEDNLQAKSYFKPADLILEIERNHHRRRRRHSREAGSQESAGHEDHPSKQARRSRTTTPHSPPKQPMATSPNSGNLHQSGVLQDYDDETLHIDYEAAIFKPDEDLDYSILDEYYESLADTEAVNDRTVTSVDSRVKDDGNDPAVDSDGEDSKLARPGVAESHNAQH